MAKLSFYTEHTVNGWVGRCKQLPALTYGPKAVRNTALSGIRRLAKRLGVAPVTVPAQGVAIPPLPAGKRKINRFAFVIDRSGSMSSLTHAAIKALRANIETIRQQAALTGQESRITVITFDDSIETLVFDQPVQNLQYLNDSNFAARGSTALFDATGQAIERFADIFIRADEDAAYLVMAITDGAENASRRFNADSLKSLMGRVQATDRWTLTFLLPPGSKAHFARSFGIPEGNVQEWEGTVRGVEQYSAQNNSGLNTYYASRSIGVNSTKSFYTDASKVTAKDLKTLIDIRNQVSVWTVEKEAKLREFCEQKSGRALLKGAAFYALTKDEKKVQPYKQILIMEKGKSAVYCGANARQLLGLPTGQTVRVIPGNHANYDIFVQSTSTNRVLVRGTKVVYYPSVGVTYKEGPSAPQARAKK